MNRMLALMIAMVMLLLCACGQEAAPAQTEQNAEETHDEQSAQTNEDGYYIEEETFDDGTIITSFYNGGPDGALVKVSYEYPEGAYAEERYSEEGKLEYTIYGEADGFASEMYCYPSGNVEKTITKMPDGSYEEMHYLDNGTVDFQTGAMTFGTVTYVKQITPDGQVEEFTYDIRVEEDGTTWSTEELEDGTVIQTHYDQNGILMEQLFDNEAEDHHIKTEFYENGSEKSRDSYYGDSKTRDYIEYYEDNSVKYSLIEYEEGKREEKFNEAGYTVYYYESTLEMEFFADDSGELVKYVEKGTVYEGDAIPDSAKDLFAQVRIVPAEDSVMTQGEDGSNVTTTTYADGTVTTNTTAADGTFSYETVKPNGERNYEEYYASGHLKLAIYETADSFQEAHYDEEGYYTYFRFVIPGQEMEITCDETGKVDKVLVNGKEEADIEKYVKDMFFRSW